MINEKCKMGTVKAKLNLIIEEIIKENILSSHTVAIMSEVTRHKGNTFTQIVGNTRYNQYDSKNNLERRLVQLRKLKIENDLDNQEILEDVLEQISENEWKAILEEIKYKYAYRK